MTLRQGQKGIHLSRLKALGTCSRTRIRNIPEAPCQGFHFFQDCFHFAILYTATVCQLVQWCPKLNPLKP